MLPSSKGAAAPANLKNDGFLPIDVTLIVCPSKHSGVDVGAAAGISLPALGEDIFNSGVLLPDMSVLSRASHSGSTVLEAAF